MRCPRAPSGISRRSPLATARPTREILADLRGDRRLPMLYYIDTLAALQLLVDETESEELRRHR